MKKLLISMMLAIAAMSVVVEANAKLGGSRSIGRQSPTVARQAANPTVAPRQAAAPAPAAPAVAPKPASPWKGILGGALLGLGAGALLSHFGMGGALGAMGGMLSSILMIALLAMAAMFLYRMFRNKNAAPGGATPFAGAFGGAAPVPAGGGTPEIGSRLEPHAFQSAQPAASGVSLDKPMPAAQWGVPADFDTNAFLRHAKSSFIRMQAAWDKADVNDLREFTTPEIYAELKMQISERGAQADFTDVVTIDGELLGIETIGDEYLASVKFTGTIKSAPNAPAEPFTEVWNMAKPVSGSGGWVLAGIQQLS